MATGKKKIQSPVGTCLKKLISDPVYSAKTWVFDQSEHAQASLYIINDITRLQKIVFPAQKTTLSCPNIVACVATQEDL